MEILSGDFQEKLMNDILAKVDVSLKAIEHQYAVRSRFLSKKNACIYADITPPTLEKWLAKGLRISKIDGCFRIDVNDLEVFIKNYVM